MIDLQAIEQIKQASIAERVEAMAAILQSLKNDVGRDARMRGAQCKPFRVRKFSLGEEVTVDRDALYSERVC